MLIKLHNKRFLYLIVLKYFHSKKTGRQYIHSPSTTELYPERALTKEGCEPPGEQSEWSSPGKGGEG